MEKLKSNIQLLSLLIIFFIYRAVSAIISNNDAEFILWFLISIRYAMSRIILYRVVKKRPR